jgi:hypothetical protein
LPVLRLGENILATSRLLLVKSDQKIDNTTFVTTMPPIRY